MFIQEIIDWVSAAVDDRLHVDMGLEFPSLTLKDTGVSLLIIPLDKWVEQSPPDEFIRTFLDSRKNAKWVVIWEDMWARRKDIIKSRLLAYAGKSKRTHGRKCKIEKMSAKEALTFFNENHLMGNTTAKYRLMLTQGDQIMAAATFGRSVPAMRNGNEVKSHELIRFCHRKGYHVSGGLTKLIAHFRIMAEPQDIFTSVDREWSTGRGYAHIGFKTISHTAPLCFHIDNEYNRHRHIENGIRICNAGNVRMALTF